MNEEEQQSNSSQSAPNEEKAKKGELNPKRISEQKSATRIVILIIALKQYRLYHSNDTASLAWLQVSLFTWLAIPV